MAEYSVKVLGGRRVQLTYLEVVAALDSAGWPESEWATAAAVISAESDRVANIYNTYKEGHYGLMQMSRSAHKAWFNSLPTKNGWVEPVLNCMGGLTLWRQSRYQPWEAYTNGRYVAFKLQATAAVQSYKAKKRAAGNPSGRDFAPKVFRKVILDSLRTLIENGMLEGFADTVGDTVGAVGQGTVEAGAAATDAISEQAGSILGIAQLALGASKWLGDSKNWLRIVQTVAGGALVIAGVAIVARPAIGALPVARMAKALKSSTPKKAAAPAKKAAAPAKKTAAPAKKTAAPAKKTAAKKTAAPAGGSSS